MKLLKVIRSNEWWEYKFPPVLAVGYMVAVHSAYTLISLSVTFLTVLLSLITGAAYVSIINDAADIKDDAAAGKKNRMAKYGMGKRILLVVIPLAIGFLFALYYASYTPAMVLYIACYSCFTFYSLPPLRLKKRGIAGVIADAAGSQLFPSLLIAVFLCFKTHQVVITNQLICIGIWSFCFGLRGILWHQFYDRENDIRSGIKTFVVNLMSSEIKVISFMLIFIELIAFIALLFIFKLLFSAALLAVYFFYLILLIKHENIKLIIMNPPPANYRIFMNEYYQVFLPLSILLSAAFNQPSVLVLLFLHIALFPVKTLKISNEFYALLRKPLLNPLLPL